MTSHEAVIIGGGPAGLSAAGALLRAGVRGVVVLEREAHAGGVPLQCPYPGFGLSQFGWPYRGPRYAARLREQAAGATLMTGVSVIALRPGGELVVASGEGSRTLRAGVVLLATGICESPRAGRLVSGTRPWGVLTTGTVQRFVHLARRRPCRCAVVIGTEWVSLSALLTLRQAGVGTVAILEEAPRVVVPWAAASLASLVFRVPVLTAVSDLEVLGKEVVEGVSFARHGRRRTLACDAVVFSGQFVPEASLVRESHLELDPGTGGPVIDQHWRCSDPAYFAAGNVLRPVESAGVAGREGEAAGRAMAAALAGRLARPGRQVRIAVGAPLRYVYPQIISHPGEVPGALLMRARVTRRTRGVLLVRRNGRTVWRRALAALPERRIALPRRWMSPDGLDALEIVIQEEAPSTRREAPIGPGLETRRATPGEDNEHACAAAG